jgi:hypothetical protein
MPVSIVRNFQGTEAVLIKCEVMISRFQANSFSFITNCEIQHRVMTVAWILGQVSLVGYTNNWQNQDRCRKLNMWHASVMATVILIINSLLFHVCKPLWCKVKTCMKCEIWQMGTVLIWIFPSSIMFQRYVNNLQFYWDGRSRKRDWGWVFTSHLLIGMI